MNRLLRAVNAWRPALRDIQGPGPLEPVEVGFYPSVTADRTIHDDWDVEPARVRVPWTTWPALELEAIAEVRP